MSEVLTQRKKKPTNGTPETIDLPPLEETAQNDPSESQAQRGQGLHQLELQVAKLQAIENFRERQETRQDRMQIFQDETASRRMAAQSLKMKGDLSNLLKVAVSDETITKATGEETDRKHRKLLWGLVHDDHEVCTKVSIQRGNNSD
jgi:hypothetical protein